MRKTFAAILVFGIALISSPQNAFAYGMFTAGQTGYDISFPQGNISSLPSTYDFLVIGVTDGRAYTDNPYLASQKSLAYAYGKPLSLYMNLNAPIGSTVNGNTSTPKACAKNDKVCQAYNYGYNAAAHSYSYALGNGATSSMWWLDIEKGNSWSATKAINDATIQGATDSLNATGAIVGIYSTQSMWNTIAGSSFVLAQTTTDVTPNWIAATASLTDAQNACSQTSRIITAKGQAWLTQYVIGGLDHDYAC